MIIDVELENRPSGSQVVLDARTDYQRWPAAHFADAAARLTQRQAVFYRNLIRIAEVVGSSVLPVDFETPDGRRLYLDRGCIKIAERAGFIRELANGEHGVVDFIELAWEAGPVG